VPPTCAGATYGKILTVLCGVRFGSPVLLDVIVNTRSTAVLLLLVLFFIIIFLTTIVIAEPAGIAAAAVNVTVFFTLVLEAGDVKVNGDAV
jgi:hypothetical protein